MNWIADKKWSDQFLPEIKSILGQQFICEPPVEEDQERNTDLIVLKMDSIRICCRIRRHKFIVCQNEFTLRTARPTGLKTELAKIIEGFGNYLFYGICDAEEKHLESWFIGNLNVFRLWFNYQIIQNEGALPGTSFQNADRSSCFRVFEIDKIEKGFIVNRKQSHINPSMEKIIALSSFKYK